MTISVVSQNSINYNDVPRAVREKQLYSTAKVFREACNKIVKDHLVNYSESNLFRPISLHFAKKVIEKTKVSFTQFVVSLIYLNKYYKYCTLLNRHIPGHKKAAIPTVSHIIIVCIIQAERYVDDTPHKLSWWAEICAGETKPSDINEWIREFVCTINYRLYIHPEKEYMVFKGEVKRLAVRLLRNPATIPPEFRHSINLGTPMHRYSVPSFHSYCISPQSNIMREESGVRESPPRGLLSSGHSYVNSMTIHSNQTPNQANTIISPASNQTNTIISPASNQTNTIISPTSNQPNTVISPASSTYSYITNSYSQIRDTEASVLKITNTNLTNSPISIEESMVNQTHSPYSIFTNPNQYSFNSNTHRNYLRNNYNTYLNQQTKIQSSDYRQNPKCNKSSLSFILNENGNKDHHPSISQPIATIIIDSPQTTPSPNQYKNNTLITSKEIIEASPMDMPNNRSQELNKKKVVNPRFVKRKGYSKKTRSSKKKQDCNKKPKNTMLITPEEL